jgi:hypothetical protein
MTRDGQCDAFSPALIAARLRDAACTEEAAVPARALQRYKEGGGGCTAACKAASCGTYRALASPAPISKHKGRA